MVEDGFLERTKVSAEETFSYGDPNSFKLLPDITDENMMQTDEDHCVAEKDNSTLSHPVAHIAQCGYRCCAAPSEVHSQSSLLGPEFVDYEEIPSFSSHELASVASDLNNIAWIKSGLESLSAKAPDNATLNRVSQCLAQKDSSEQNMKNDHYHFEECRNKLMGMRT